MHTSKGNWHGENFDRPFYRFVVGEPESWCLERLFANSGCDRHPNQSAWWKRTKSRLRCREEWSANHYNARNDPGCFESRLPASIRSSSNFLLSSSLMLRKNTSPIICPQCYSLHSHCVDVSGWVYREQLVFGSLDSDEPDAIQLNTFYHC